ncbi:fibroblast growth factor receptor 3-like [Lethenteron reissneri]|uniref:fibroblast growth factor receptor 3-like n=1 Tax=Lethenteron reissneri TaxID=7753 RepID=UPI002AB73C32|nr:fibroblast growth factor receptor 3-like [Lethenteron reissneri]
MAAILSVLAAALEERRQPQRPSLRDGLPANVTAAAGSDARLRCVVLQSDGAGAVQWLKHVVVNGSLAAPNGSPYVRILTTVGVEVSDVETTQLLYLRNVSVDDSGRYTCLAVNAAGFARRSAWLLVVPRETRAGRRSLATTTAGAGKMLTASPVETRPAASLTMCGVYCAAGFLLLIAVTSFTSVWLTRRTRRASRELTCEEAEMQLIQQ